MPITHAFISAVPDSPNTAIVRPSDWNAAHVSIPRSIMFVGLDFNALNMPAALSEWQSPRTRMSVDLTRATQARVSVFIEDRVETAGALIGVQYSLDGGTVWSFLDGVSGPTVLVGTTRTINQAYSGAYVAIAAPARTDVLLRLVTQGGNGADSFSPGFVSLTVD